MFERELTDVTFVKRWSIVRTLMPQSVAEHTFLATHYANDIAVYFGLSPETHLALLKLSIWHDVDEVFTGDLPGPNKRGLLDAIGTDAKNRWNLRLSKWAEQTFSNLVNRMYGKISKRKDNDLVHLILKTADWLEAAVRMATEEQMGNRCAQRHVIPNMVGALETMQKVVENVHGVKLDVESVPFNPTKADQDYRYLHSRIERCVHEARHGQSIGPWITKEDDTRTYHDPCVDSTK